MSFERAWAGLHQASLSKMVAKKAEPGDKDKAEKDKAEQEKENQAGIECSLNNRDGCEMCGS